MNSDYHLHSHLPLSSYWLALLGRSSEITNIFDTYVGTSSSTFLLYTSLTITAHSVQLSRRDHIRIKIYFNFLVISTDRAEIVNIARVVLDIQLPDIIRPIIA